jgi:hypothetical protein
VISYEDYLNFNNNAIKGRSDGGNWGGSQGSFVKLYQCVNKENLDRSLILRGLPYKISTLQLQNFLEGYGKIPAENIFIEEFNGKRTGSALVVFENDQVAQDAKTSLQKSEMEGRYIELFDQNDEFMRKVCKLDL